MRAGKTAEWEGKAGGIQTYVCPNLWSAVIPDSQAGDHCFQAFHHLCSVVVWLMAKEDAHADGATSSLCSVLLPLNTTPLSPQSVKTGIYSK